MTQKTSTKSTRCASEVPPFVLPEHAPQGPEHMPQRMEKYKNRELCNKERNEQEADVCCDACAAKLFHI